MRKNDEGEQLTIRDLCEMLAQVQARHGNLLVVIDDDDTGHVLKMKGRHISIGRGRLRIGACYGDEQDLT